MLKINQDKNQEDIVIAAIAKYENEYLGEWIDYHLKLGFDKIYIYDDNPKEYSDIKTIPEIKKNLYKKVFIISLLNQNLINIFLFIIIFITLTHLNGQCLLILMSFLFFQDLKI